MGGLGRGCGSGHRRSGCSGAEPGRGFLGDGSARAEPPPEVPKPVRGDWIEHHKFGLCKIEGLSGDGVCIIKLPNGTRKKIKIDAMLVLMPREDGERRIFPVAPKPKRGSTS